MKVGVPKETAEGERRVALIPDVVRTLAGKGIEVAVESGAGEEAGHPDSEYEEAGATVGPADVAWGAEIVLRVAVPTAPRGGGRLFPMMPTAAGTVAPARVLVLGAGVAGLQAIATAKRLGAVVTGFDIRRAAWEQIASLGGRPLELDFIPDAEAEGGYARPLTEEENEKVREALAESSTRQDVIITTALIPGRPAPLLITAEAVRGMQPGSVIVDLAAESGGNCELTKAGETVLEDGVKVIAPLNLPSEMATHASQLYSKNVENLLGLLVDDEGSLTLDLGDEIVAGACITHEGEIVNERARAAAGVSA